MGAILAGGIFMILIYVFVIILGIIAWWKIFTKAGKPGWACIIPIYNVLVFLEIIGKPWWWLILFLIPGLNLIFMIWAYNLLSKSFGFDAGFTVGLILLSIIFMLILAFGPAVYAGPAGSEGNRPAPPAYE